MLENRLIFGYRIFIFTILGYGPKVTMADRCPSDQHKSHRPQNVTQVVPPLRRATSKTGCIQRRYQATFAPESQAHVLQQVQPGANQGSTLSDPTQSSALSFTQAPQYPTSPCCFHITQFQKRALKLGIGLSSNLCFSIAWYGCIVTPFSPRSRAEAQAQQLESSIILITS
jgi:hypothetical protein